jgi:hypothetical protein
MVTGARVGGAVAATVGAAALGAAGLGDGAAVPPHAATRRTDMSAASLFTIHPSDAFVARQCTARVS